MLSINPATERELARFEEHSPAEVDRALAAARREFKAWREQPFSRRAGLMTAAATYLRKHKARLSGLITAEMGKPIGEAEAEVEKCAWACDYFAESAEQMLADQPVASSASLSYVRFQPLGVILAVMPWNFPLWQVFRFAAPTLMAGNTAILKHASNVPQCSLAIQQVFDEVGFPKGVFQSLLVGGAAVASIIEDERIAAVSLTGSDVTGTQIASVSGRVLKKSLLELGGSDPFIVLEDADLDAAALTGRNARFMNAGQSCIAAKRFIVVESVGEAFEQKLAAAVTALKLGDPSDPGTQVGPLARRDLVENLDKQVRKSVSEGARVLVGGEPRKGAGYFYQPTVLAGVTRRMPVFREETFGPVASVIRVKSEAEAVEVANDTAYGLGAAVFTRNTDRGRRLAQEIEAGSVFINGQVSSDPRLPFGGVKRSGYGRELSEYGIREFTNIQTIWVGPAKAQTSPAAQPALAKASTE
jgi:succinate-semialdehyde dehydrogenase/glutarate-semialdehyde dehydrogenase